MSISRAAGAFEPDKKGCQDFLAHWREVALASTNEAFDIMESNGVSPELRAAYFQMPDDPDWPAQLNVIRKPSWRLTAAEALKYRLVTTCAAEDRVLERCWPKPKIYPHPELARESGRREG